MKLYSGIVSVFGLKVEVAALEKHLSLELELVPFSIGDGYSPKHPEVVRVNPKQQVPVLIDGDLEIFDSTQIAEYFESIRPLPALWPDQPKPRARARLLELKIDEVFFPNVVQLFPANRAQADAAAIERAQANIRAFYGELERWLDASSTEYFVGTFSYADIAWLCAQFMAEALGVTLSQDFPRLLQLRRRLMARPSAAPLLRALDYAKSLGLELHLE